MTTPIEYLDSSIIVAYILGPNDPFYKSAKNILENDIINGTTVGLISMLSLLEIIDVIRKRVTERTNRKLLDSMNEANKKSYIKAESESKISELIDTLTIMEEKGYIIFADFTAIDLKQIVNRIYSYSKAYFGNISKSYFCRICRTPFESYSYRGLGWIDLMHAYLALNLCADGFMTADKSFKDLTIDSDFSNLKFTIL